MLMLSPSQAKNYFSKLESHHHNDGCGCCYNSTDYVIDKNRILCKISGENKGNYYNNVSVIAKIKKGVRK